MGAFLYEKGDSMAKIIINNTVVDKDLIIEKAVRNVEKYKKKEEKKLVKAKKFVFRTR